MSKLTLSPLEVESTLLATIAYDGQREVLQLEFRSGAVYRYSGVPADIYRALMQASSKGSYFNQYVRGQFPYALLPSTSQRLDKWTAPEPARN